MIKIAFVALGGGIGSVLRYIISRGITLYFGQLTMLGTLSVNLIGSFFIGILWALVEYKQNFDNLRLLLIVGLLGGFTTFSSYAIETVNLLKDNEFKVAILYIIGSNIGGILLAFLGYFIVKQLSTINIS